MNHMKIDIQRIEWLLVDAGICPGELVKGERLRIRRPHTGFTGCSDQVSGSCDQCHAEFLEKYEQGEE